LENAWLRGAHLEGANLTGSNLRRANLDSHRPSLMLLTVVDRSVENGSQASRPALWDDPRSHGGQRQAPFVR
jgi:hypothetical protein